jgi:hypothetical protein
MFRAHFPRAVFIAKRKSTAPSFFGSGSGYARATPKKRMFPIAPWAIVLFTIAHGGSLSEFQRRSATRKLAN